MAQQTLLTGSMSGSAAKAVSRSQVGAPQRWAELEDELAVRREIVRTVADIKLLPAGKGSRRAFGRHRLDWRWKSGPDSDTETA